MVWKLKMSISTKMHLFVVPGKGDMSLGMLDINLLNILKISCDTVGARKEEKGVNYNQNKQNTISAESEQCSTNTGLEEDCNKKGQ